MTDLENEALEKLQDAAYMMTGMTLDREIPERARECLRERADELLAFVQEHSE